MMMCDTSAFTHNTNGRVEGSLIAKDIWSPTPAFMATSEPLSLPVAAGGGFSQDGKNYSSIPDILISTNSLVFLSAFDITDCVTIGGSSIWQSWYLPLDCNAPIRLTWKL
jgi:hypothetical protein